MNTFNAWFLQSVSLLESGNRNMKAYAEAANPSLSDKESRKRALFGEPEGVVMAAGSKSVTLVHSIVDLGGTLSRPESKVVCLQGMSNNACPFLMEVDSFLEESTIITPTIESILQCSSVDELKELEPPAARISTRSNNDDTDTSFECSSVFFLAPWQLKAVLEAESKDPFELIVALTKAAKEFDENAVSDESLTDKAVTFGAPALRWLWAVAKNSIPEAKLTFGMDDSELREFSQRRHAQCILPPIPTGGVAAPVTGGSSETLSMLGSQISKFAESNDKTNALRALEIEKAKESELNKKNRYLKYLRYDNKMMLLNAMSEDGETPAVQKILQRS